MSKKNCFYPADILLPKQGFEQWAVIACDQYTSEPEYWQEVQQIAGDAPSALRLILPEVYLGAEDEAKISAINKNMQNYIDNGVFKEYNDTLVYVEREQTDGCIRHGLVGKIDLACYDYRKGSSALVRATEQTVLERIPPRVKIRKNAPLELPHVMLLIDDPDDTVFKPLKEQKNDFELLYDFELMKNSGNISGRRLSAAAAHAVHSALESLSAQSEGLLFCVGDGNHSLATAKECYEQNPSEASQYALVEVVNIHDEALKFEPIYRVVFGAELQPLLNAFRDYCGGEYYSADAQKFTCIYGGQEVTLSVKPCSKLCVGTLQNFLDQYILEHPEIKIDYIHGEDSVKKLCSKPQTIGFLFEGMRKCELFPAVKLDGSLPRKTFSMGHADDKRFYIEARKIKD